MRLDYITPKEFVYDIGMMRECCSGLSLVIVDLFEKTCVEETRFVVVGKKPAVAKRISGR